MHSDIEVVRAVLSLPAWELTPNHMTALLGQEQRAVTLVNLLVRVLAVSRLPAVVAAPMILAAATVLKAAAAAAAAGTQVVVVEEVEAETQIMADAAAEAEALPM